MFKDRYELVGEDESDDYPFVSEVAGQVKA